MGPKGARSIILGKEAPSQGCLMSPMPWLLRVHVHLWLCTLLPLLLLPQIPAERPCLVFVFVSAEMACDFVVCLDSAEMASDFAVYMNHVRHACLNAKRGRSAPDKGLLMFEECPLPQIPKDTPSLGWRHSRVACAVLEFQSGNAILVQVQGTCLG